MIAIKANSFTKSEISALTKNKDPKKVIVEVKISLLSKALIKGFLYGSKTSWILWNVARTIKLTNALKILGFIDKNTFTETKKTFLEMFANSQ